MNKKTLLPTLFLLALSGMLLHYRIHNFMVPDRHNPGSFVFESTRFLSFIFNAVDLIVVTGLFSFRKTAIYGYLLNGLIVIYGTIFMTHFSVSELTAKAIPAQDWLIKSTFADISIAWADFFAGKALYDMYLKG